MNYLVKTLTLDKTLAVFCKKMGKDGTQISHGYSGLINVCTTLILVSD